MIGFVFDVVGAPEAVRLVKKAMKCVGDTKRLSI